MDRSPPRNEPGPVARATDELRSARFSVKPVLGASLRVFARHALVLIPLAAVFHAVPTYFRWRHALEAVEDARTGGMVSFASRYEQAAWVTGWLLPLAFQAIVTLAVFQALRGGSPDFVRSIGRGSLRFLHAFGAAFLVGLSLLLPMFTLIVLPIALARVQSELYYLGVPVGLALVLYAASRWFVAVQAAVVEKMNPYGAMVRSAVLTHGHRGHVLGILMAVHGVPLLLTPGALWSVGAASWFEPRVPTDPNLAGLLLGAGLDALFSALQAVTAAVTYHALRRAKDGVGIDDLLTVFD